MHHHDSLLFAPPTIKDKDYVYVDPNCPVFTPEVRLDDSWVASSCASEILEYLDPVEVIFDTTMSVEGELLSPLFPDNGKEWIETSMVGGSSLPLLDASGLLVLDEQQPLSSSPMTTQVEKHPNLFSSFPPTHNNLNPPIEIFHGIAYDYRHDQCCYQHSPLSPQLSSTSTTPFDVDGAANFDMMNMMVSLDINNCGYTNASGSDISF